MSTIRNQTLTKYLNLILHSIGNFKVHFKTHGKIAYVLFEMHPNFPSK
jgi:hypothetical protein